jgi:Cys-rich four helix bundle protein (predicted Tat secretion target)
MSRLALSRRDAICGAATAAALVVAPSLALAQAQGHQHHHHGHHHGPAPLVMTSADCVMKGRECVSHCLELIKGGDLTVVDCARSVQELIAACDALHSLAVVKSKHLVAFARATRAVCVACEIECRKHADKHAECKACMESCSACIKDIDKLA